ncbi:MAG: DUF3053 domain-containing protein [Comamonadaceae bacterium]|nr:MAG: DUF3053 domain-containing protein [Comamonadaceae bacterium]
MNIMTRTGIALLLTAPLLLTACGDKEPDQRATFSKFLQTRILDKPGVRVPQPTEEEKKSFGDYASHYAVITDFHAGMNQSVTSMDAAMQQGSIRTVNDLISRRGDLVKARTTMNEINTAIAKQQAQADAARAQLKQPEDLKPVYDSAYDRVVTQPANAFKTVFPLVDASLQRAVDTADYVEKNKAKIQVSGATVRVSDPKVQAELNTRLQALNSGAAALNKSQADMQKMIMGR